MEEKPSDEFKVGKFHLLDPVSVGIVTPAKPGLLLIYIKDSVIGYGHPVGIPAEV